MIIRLERQSGDYKGKGQYDGICEELDDLDAIETNGYADFNGSHVELGAGSIMHCLEDGKPHVLCDDGSFAEAFPEAAS